MSPFFVVFAPLNYVHMPCPLPPSPSSIKSTPNHLLFDKKYSVTFIHRSQRKANKTEQLLPPFPHTANITAPPSQTKPTMARAMFLVVLRSS